jgi:hypothetical protein
VFTEPVVHRTAPVAGQIIGMVLIRPAFGFPLKRAAIRRRPEIGVKNNIPDVIRIPFILFQNQAEIHGTLIMFFSGKTFLFQDYDRAAVFKQGAIGVMAEVER